MWRKAVVGNLIEVLADAFDQAIKLADFSHAGHGDAETTRAALALAQTIIGEIAEEMCAVGTRDSVLQSDWLATMQAKHDAAELAMRPCCVPSNTH